MFTFSHRYCSKTDVKFKRADGGGLIPDVLEVTATIELDPAGDDFDQAKVNELEMAVVEYAKGKGDRYREIIFISGR